MISWRIITTLLFSTTSSHRKRGGFFYCRSLPNAAFLRHGLRIHDAHKLLGECRKGLGKGQGIRGRNGQTEQMIQFTDLALMIRCSCFKAEEVETNVEIYNDMQRRAMMGPVRNQGQSEDAVSIAIRISQSSSICNALCSDALIRPSRYMCSMYHVYIRPANML